METIIKLFSPESLPIDFVMIILVLLGGLFQRRYTTELKLNAALKTLIVGTLFCSVYILIKIMSATFKEDDPLRWFFSYVVATSMYELLMKRFVNKLFPDEKIEDHAQK